MKKMSSLPFGARDKFGYALGDFGCNMSFAFINTYLMVFYVTCMGIKSEHYAIIILLAKIFDAINDPIIGRICDTRTPGKNGKFKPWIKWASLPLLISSVLMFIYIPNAPYWIKISMCLILYCIWSIAYTSVNVPYGSLQSVITNVPSERASLSTWRSIGAIIAQIPVMIILPLIAYDKNANPRGSLFIVMVGVMGIIGFAAFIGLRKLTVERVEPKIQPEQNINYINTLCAFFKNKNMLGVTISTVANIALMMTVTNSMQYLFMLYFKDTHLLSIATVIAGAPMGVGVLFSEAALKKYSKKQLCTYPFVISVVASAAAAFIPFSNPYIWMLVIGIAMFGSGFYLVLVWALVADCIDFQEKQTGRREEGSIYATYSLFRKIAQGLGAAIISSSLHFTGYNETLDAAEQAAGVAEKVYFMTGILPAIGAAICFISMLYLYKLNDKAEEEK